MSIQQVRGRVRERRRRSLGPISTPLPGSLYLGRSSALLLRVLSPPPHTIGSSRRPTKQGPLGAKALGRFTQMRIPTNARLQRCTLFLPGEPGYAKKPRFLPLPPEEKATVSHATCPRRAPPSSSVLLLRGLRLCHILSGCAIGELPRRVMS